MDRAEAGLPDAASGELGAQDYVVKWLINDFAQKTLNLCYTYWH